MATYQVFKIEVVCGNAAFGETDDDRNSELARILRTAASKLESGKFPEYLFDVNGNCVGGGKIVNRRES